MGRQTTFHILPEDAGEFLAFARAKASVVCTAWYSDRSEVSEEYGAEGVEIYCLWNQELLPELRRSPIPGEAKNRYGVDFGLPVVQFCSPAVTMWSGRPALRKGRVWADCGAEDEAFWRWYGSLVRWIRRNCEKSPVAWLGSYAGHAAANWHRGGGLFLPIYDPPVTAEWTAKLAEQHPLSR